LIAVEEFAPQENACIYRKSTLDTLYKRLPKEVRGDAKRGLSVAIYKAIL